MPDTGLYWPEQWSVPVLGVRGWGDLPGVRTAVASHSCNFRVQSPNLLGPASERQQTAGGTGPDSKRNPNVPFPQDILKCAQVTPQPLPLYTELLMDRY